MSLGLWHRGFYIQEQYEQIRRIVYEEEQEAKVCNWVRTDIANL